MTIAVLRLGAQPRAAEYWSVASAAIPALRGLDPEDEEACRRAEEELVAFLAKLRKLMASAAPDRDVAFRILNRVLTFLDLGAVARTYLQYSVGDMLKISVEALRQYLPECAESADSWGACLDRFEGIDNVPLMTVHKSKGLEYDTMLFVGLDDKMWWSHRPGDPEGVATFFVALSRARQRAIFTFCNERGGRKGVADLYQLLADAGVREISIGGRLSLASSV